MRIVLLEEYVVLDEGYCLSISRESRRHDEDHMIDICMQKLALH